MHGGVTTWKRAPWLPGHWSPERRRQARHGPGILRGGGLFHPIDLHGPINCWFCAHKRKLLHWLFKINLNNAHVISPLCESWAPAINSWLDKMTGCLAALHSSSAEISSSQRPWPPIGGDSRLMNGWMDGWMKMWMDDIWIDGWLNEIYQKIKGLNEWMD